MPRSQPLSKRARRLLATVPLLVAGCVLGAAFVGHTQTSRAAQGRMYEAAKQTPARKVAIILGALVYRDGGLSDIVADRIACGVELYKSGRVQRLLVSGDHGRDNYDEVSTMGAALVAQGVPPAHVFLDHAGFRTLDTMQRARDVFGVKDAAICTQRFHLPRALYWARQFDIDAVGVVADKRRYRSHFYNQFRETFARAAAVLDHVLGRRARFLGPPVEIAGDGRVTHVRQL